jgi:hypothetical protein
MPNHLLIYGLDGVELVCKPRYGSANSVRTLTGQTGLFSNTPEAALGIWNMVITDYTRRQLSISYDKLVAISAYARTVHSAIGGRYVAGL